jgi:flavodoxin I
LFYSNNSNKTKIVAKKIAAEFPKDLVENVIVEILTEDEFLSFDNYILGVPTWFDGELPSYWDEFLPAIEEMDLKGKTFAIFGLGDQKNYPENFVDGIGIMADILESRGGKIIGHTPTEGYTFESSSAIRDNKFMGLALDQENQARLTNDRLEHWINDLKVYFK